VLEKITWTNPQLKKHKNSHKIRVSRPVSIYRNRKHVDGE